MRVENGTGEEGDTVARSNSQRLVETAEYTVGFTFMSLKSEGHWANSD